VDSGSSGESEASAGCFNISLIIPYRLIALSRCKLFFDYRFPNPITRYDARYNHST
jgi:hypothetical protein